MFLSNSYILSVGCVDFKDNWLEENANGQQMVTPEELQMHYQLTKKYIGR